MRPVLAILALAIMLSMPSSVVAWGSKGSGEPDTHLDQTGGYMWPTADPSPVAGSAPKVYFNGFVGVVAGYYPTNVPTAENPNFATVGSGVPTFPDEPHAMLGVWKDCNKDGYVGLGDNALYEYRSTVLLDTSVCPQGAANIPGKPYNDGTWVHEFIPIGIEPVNGQRLDPWSIQDTGARVWIDDGVPGGPPTGTCYTLAYPPGSFHSVGGMVGVADCYLSGRVDATGSMVACEASCGAWTAVKAQQNPWGAEDGGSDATAWDCSQPPVQTVSAANAVVAVNHPKVPPSTSTSGTPAGTANATGSGVTPQCSPWYDSKSTNPGQQVADEPYTYESHVNPVVGVKIAPDWNLFYNYQQRPGAVVGGQLGASDPGDFAGVGEPVFGRGFWESASVRAASRNPVLDRSVLTPQKVTVYTYYAYVSSSAISGANLWLPSGSPGASPSPGVYGQEACQGATTGIVNAWQCDPTQWYPQGTQQCRNSLLGPGPDGQGAEECARPGDPYTLRDTDCYDFSVAAARNAGVGYGVLTGTSCTAI